MKKILIALVLAGTAFMSSCEKEAKTGSVDISMEYIWGMDISVPFEMNTPLFHPNSFDTLTFTTFKHYLSHIELIGEDGSVYEPASDYFLLDFSDPNSLTLNFDDVPVGNYTTLRMTFGIDSAANVAGAQTGVLDPIHEMFWSWTQGYIMIKAEGNSPQADMGLYKYHLGGFTGATNTVMTRDFDLTTTPCEVVEDGSKTITLLNNPARIFHTYGTVANGGVIMMPTEAAAQMAEDYNTWIRVSSVE